MFIVEWLFDKMGYQKKIQWTSSSLTWEDIEKSCPKPVKKVAVLGGSGSFAIEKAIEAGADIYVTADIKYHEFYKAENKLVIADIGHYESEQFTKNLLVDILTKKFPNFAIILSQKNTNPIYYL